MFSASPLVKNDSRIPEIVERLKRGASLTKESADMGYSHHVQFRLALKEAIGVEAYAELMAGRAKMFRQKNTRYERSTRSNE